jgi:peptide-methionine (S)-S-oxide reductase
MINPRITVLMAVAAVVVPLGLAAEAGQEYSENEMPGAETQATTAIFAGGCFWCMEPPFDQLEGVKSTESGYIGGRTANPTYEQVSSGSTGHAEAVKVTYDPDLVAYQDLLDVFWRNIDPVDAGGQFCDRGNQYRSAIFYVDDDQKTQALASLDELEMADRFARPVVTEVEAAGTFYPAEDYHQNYYEKNPLRYKYYRYSCGRDERLQEVWGDPTGH